MKISLITNYNIPKNFNPPKVQSFGTNECKYFETNDTFTKNEICTNTYALRGDLEWDDLALLMCVTFKNKKKVNVYSLACSDGSEPYSMAIALKEELRIIKANPDKFFPIIASDKNRELIQKNKKGLWNLKLADLDRFEGYGYHSDKYIEKSKEKLELTNDNLKDRTTTYRVKDDLREKVKFSHSDIFDRLNMIEDDSNTVILCRNVLPYLHDDKKVAEIAQLASRKLKEGSLFVIGDYDYKTGMSDYLLNVGFKDLFGDNKVFQKKAPIERHVDKVHSGIFNSYF